MTSTSTIPPKFKAKKPKIKAKRKLLEAVASSTSKERSWVWEHFSKFDKPIMEIIDKKPIQVGIQKRAKCNYCSTDLACDSYGNGSSTLRRHIEDVCKMYPGRLDLDKGQQVFSSGCKDLVMTKWSQEACKQAAVEMIVIDELPFSFIEREGFRHFCAVAVPRFEVPSRRSIVKIFLSMYAAKKQELKNELRSHCVCLTTDTWTSVQNINYMVLTAHFIDGDWTMHKRILNFCVIANHQGNSIGKLLEACLLDWEVERVLTISVDNASANKVALDFDRKKMSVWKNPPILGGKYLHVRC
jgi:hypothetical protein